MGFHGFLGIKNYNVPAFDIFRRIDAIKNRLKATNAEFSGYLVA